MANNNAAIATRGAAKGITKRGSPKHNEGVKRYNLALPEELYSELQFLAESEHTTILDLIRRFIKLGLVAVQIEKDPNAKIVIHEGDRQRELIFLA